VILDFSIPVFLSRNKYINNLPPEADQPLAEIYTTINCEYPASYKVLGKNP